MKLGYTGWGFISGIKVRESGRGTGRCLGLEGVYGEGFDMWHFLGQKGGHSQRYSKPVHRNFRLFTMLAHRGV